LSVPDEGYSRNAARALNLISTFFYGFPGPDPLPPPPPTFITTMANVKFSIHFDLFSTANDDEIVIPSSYQS